MKHDITFVCPTYAPFFHILISVCHIFHKCVIMDLLLHAQSNSMAGPIGVFVLYEVVNLLSSPRHQVTQMMLVK